MSKRHRRHSTAKKREIVEAYLNGEALHALGKQHDACRSLVMSGILPTTRWSRDGSVLSVTGVRYFYHLQDRGGGAGTRVALKSPPMATAVKARRSTQYAGRTKVQRLRSRWSVVYVIPGKFHENVLNFTHAHPAPPKFNVPEAKTPESSSPP